MKLPEWTYFRELSVFKLYTLNVSEPQKTQCYKLKERGFPEELFTVTSDWSITVSLLAKHNYVLDEKWSFANSYSRFRPCNHWQVNELFLFVKNYKVVYEELFPLHLHNTVTFVLVEVSWSKHHSPVTVATQVGNLRSVMTWRSAEALPKNYSCKPARQGESCDTKLHWNEIGYIYVFCCLF